VRTRKRVSVLEELEGITEFRSKLTSLIPKNAAAALSKMNLFLHQH